MEFYAWAFTLYLKIGQVTLDESLNFTSRGFCEISTMPGTKSGLSNY